MTDTTTAPNSALSAQQLEDFKKNFEERMDFYKIPGAALGIVQNGEVLVSQGFGVRDLETNDPVTPKTLFALGSVTKSLTAFLIATQVDEGLYTWDTPVSEISSQYKFPDAINHPLKVKDLLGMTSGIDGAINPYANIQDLILGANAMHWNDQSAIHIIRNIPFLPCWPGSYGDYNYNNELFASAGYLTPLKNKKPTSQLLQAYKQLMDKKVFNAIGMESTRITGVLSSASNDYAVSYGLDMSDGEPKIFEKGAISINYIGGVAPAGQCISNVEDMNRYLITLLNDGVNPDGQQVVKAETLQEVWNVKGKKPPKPSDEGITGITKYGMGWWIEEIERKSNPAEKITVRHHGGFLPSWFSMQMLVPEKNIGIIILANGCFGRWFGMEMTQELLKLLYGSDVDEKKFIKNGENYTTFLNNFKQAVSKDKVSSYTIAPENLDDVEMLLGNYEGGWTLDLDQDHHLVLFKNGWVYHLYPSPENPFDTYYIGASNDHRGIRVRKNPANNEFEATKIIFFKDNQEVPNMQGPQIGRIKKLPNPLESSEVQAAVLSLMQGNLLPKLTDFINSLNEATEKLQSKLVDLSKEPKKMRDLFEDPEKLPKLFEDPEKVSEMFEDPEKARGVFDEMKKSYEISAEQINPLKQLLHAMKSKKERISDSDTSMEIEVLDHFLLMANLLDDFFSRFLTTSSKEATSDSEATSPSSKSSPRRKLRRLEEFKKSPVSAETIREIAAPENQLD